MGKGIATQLQEAQSPIQDHLKEKHTKIHINQTNKNWPQRANINRIKEKATNNILCDPQKANSWTFNRNAAGQKEMAGYT